MSGVQIFDAHALFLEILGERFGETFRQRQNERSFTVFRRLADRRHKIFHLILDGAYIDDRIEKSCR